MIGQNNREDQKIARSPQVELTLTEEGIREAIYNDSSHCMWAEAVKKAFPRATRVSVDLATIRFTDPRKGLRYTYLTPRFAQQSLVDFDQGDDKEAYIEAYAGTSVRLRGGMVTLAKSRQDARKAARAGERTEQQRRSAISAAAKARAALNLKNQRMVLREKDGHVPERVGGSTPPLGRGRRGFSGVRRTFGIRGLR